MKEKHCDFCRRIWKGLGTVCERCLRKLDQEDG